MKTTPITSRLRANKQIKKDPASQPILHIGEVSPLKQLARETTTQGPDTVKKQKTAGDILETPEAVGGGEAGSGYDAAMTRLLNEGRTYEQLAEAGHGTVSGLKDRFPGYGDNTGRGPDKEEEVVVPGETKTTQDPVKTRERSTALTPYEYYQARLIDKRSRGKEKRVERGQQRDLAKEVGRRTEGGIIKKLKARRAVMRGDADLATFKKTFGDERGLQKFKEAQQNYEVMRGLSSKQQAAGYDPSQAQQQAAQSRSAGESIRGREVTAGVTDIDRPDVQAQKRELGGKITQTSSQGTPKEKTFTDDMTISGSPARMMSREMNAVGMKSSRPLKKGYFKNK